MSRESPSGGWKEVYEEMGVEADPDDGPDEDTETVYVSASTHTGGKILHTDPDCHRLSYTAVFDRPRDSYPDDQRMCQVCTGEASQGGISPGENPHALRNALLEAGNEEVSDDGE